MDKSMKTKNIILLILAAILAASSKGEEVESFDVTKMQKQLIPYENEQIIRYIDSAGQAVDITIIKSEQTWIRGDFEEDDEYVIRRRKSTTLKSELENFEIDLFFYPKYDHLTENYSGWFCIDIKLNTTDWWCHFFYSDEDGNLTSDYPYYIIETHKSLEINGKVYCDVVEQRYTGLAYDDRVVDSYLFYNKTYGILQIDRDGKNILTIVPDEDKGNNSPGMIDYFDLPLAEHSVR